MLLHKKDNLVTYKDPLLSLRDGFPDSLDALGNLSSVFIQTTAAGKIN